MAKGHTLTDSELADTPGSVRPNREIEYRPYFMLAAAVVRQAVEDYLGYVGRVGSLTEAKGFLYGTTPFWVANRSHWFGMLGLSGDARTVGKMIRYYAEHREDLESEEQ